MLDLQLFRINSTSRSTLGILTLDCGFLCHTLELPWLQNARNVSCIPCNRYLLQEVPAGQSSKFPYQHLRVLDVVGRSGILIHIINTTKDTRGCIGVGQSTSPHFIGSSKKALIALNEVIMPAVQAGNCYLTIQNL